MKLSFYDYCVEQERPELLQQWDVEHNDLQSPQSLTYGSHQKVWWCCEKGHRWQAAVKSRVSGAGCPYCAGRSLTPGENDLATTHPDLIRQWDFARNGPLRPQELSSGSRKKVWWRCERGHRWQALVTARTRGAGCPVCAGKVIVPGENDLSSRYPQVAQQWDACKNAPLTPETCAPASNRRVWWRCPLGHAYQAAVGARTTGGSGCPYCAGHKVLAGFNDLSALEPAVAEQWHPTLNGALTPEEVMVGSRHKAWWQCEQGHVWQAAVYSRTGPERCGCPVCAGQGRRQRRYGAPFLPESPQTRDPSGS